MIASFPLVPWVLISKLPIPFDRKAATPKSFWWHHSLDQIQSRKYYHWFHWCRINHPYLQMSIKNVFTLLIYCRIFWVYWRTPNLSCSCCIYLLFFFLITFQFFNLFHLLLLVATIILIAVRKCQNIDARRSQMYMSKFEYMVRTVPFSACN